MSLSASPLNARAHVYHYNFVTINSAYVFTVILIAHCDGNKLLDFKRFIGVYARKY